MSSKSHQKIKTVHIKTAGFLFFHENKNIGNQWIKKQININKHIPTHLNLEIKVEQIDVKQNQLAVNRV